MPSPSTINVFEPYETEKPIVAIKRMLEEMKQDVETMNREIVHIKGYIRKNEIKQQIKEEKEKQQEAEYVKTGWLW